MRTIRNWFDVFLFQIFSCLRYFLGAGIVLMKYDDIFCSFSILQRRLLANKLLCAIHHLQFFEPLKERLQRVPYNRRNKRIIFLEVLRERTTFVLFCSFSKRTLWFAFSFIRIYPSSVPCNNVVYEFCQWTHRSFTHLNVHRQSIVLKWTICQQISVSL